MEITVAVTTFNEGEYLDRLLSDLARQICTLQFEIILLEAGDYGIDQPEQNLLILFLIRLEVILLFVLMPGHI